MPPQSILSPQDLIRGIQPTEEVRQRMLQDHALGPPSKGAFRPDSRLVAIEDGGGSAASARVTGENNLGSESRSVNAGVATTYVTVETSPVGLVGSRSERKQIQVQNLDPSNSVHIRIGGGGASTEDLMLAPGQMYSFPPGATADHAIDAVASGPGTKVVVVEFT